MNLETKLTAWQAANLMTAQQAAAIRAYEEHASSAKSWAVWGIACIGLAAILLGILAIVGVNWHLLSPTLKLAGAFGGFAVLLGLVKLSYKSPHKHLFLDALMVTWQGYTLACVALIGQLYNLQGPLWQTLLFWLILISPTVIVSNRFTVNILWLGLATATLALTFADTFSHSTILIGLWLALPFLYLILSDATRPLPFLNRFTTPLRILGWTSFLITWVISQALTLGHTSADATSIALLLGTLGALLAASISKRNIPASHKKILISTLALYTTTLIITRYTYLPELLDHIIALALVMLLAIYAAQQHHKRLFNCLTLLAVARLAMLYVLLAGSLLTTGIGLISTGALILGLLYGWYTYRTHVLKKLGE